MDVLESLKNLLSACPLMDEFNGNDHVDYTSSDIPDTYGIYNVGTRKLSSDIVGNETYRSDFILYAYRMAHDDYQRLINSTWLLKMTYWLDKQKDIKIEDKENNRIGIVTSIVANNAMLFRIPTGDINDGVDYSIQIAVTYEFMEE